MNIHPAAIAREATPLILQIRTFEKAKDFAAQSEKPLVLCGGKAVKTWLGYGSNVTRWMGHYERETEASSERRTARIEEGLKVTLKAKVKKEKKLTLKEHMRLMIGLYVPGEDGNFHAPANYLTPEQRDAILALIAPKEKKA